MKNNDICTLNLSPLCWGSGDPEPITRKADVAKLNLSDLCWGSGDPEPQPQ